MSTPSAPRVVAVVVAFERRELLREALDGIGSQTRPVDAVVVIDNNSHDDSAEVAAGHPVGADVVRLVRNTGGAGGFAAGIAQALRCHAPDLVWLMDDDTVPTPDALRQLLAARSAVGEDVALLASRAVWTDGTTEHPMNRPRRRTGVHVDDRETLAGVMPVRSASFVSVLLDARAVARHGLPVADYFIWNDDFEYTLRLLRRGRGYYATRSVVLHKTRRPGSSDDDPGARFYYEVRNKLWLFRFGSGLGLGDRVVYGSGTALRWLRTLARSRDRRALIVAGRRGLLDGMRTRPRSNTESLADLGAVAQHVASVESGRR